MMTPSPHRHDDDKDEAEIDWTNKRAILRGPHVFNIMLVIGLTILIVFTFIHYEDSKIGRREFIDALRDQAVATREATVANKEQTCIMTVPVDKRQDPGWMEWCRAQARR